MKKTFWQSTGFWVSALMVGLSLFGGSEALASQAVAAVGGVVAAFFAVRQFANSAKFGGWYETLVQGNTLNYIAQVVLLLGIPNVDQLIPPLKDLISGFSEGNWGRVISALVSIATIVFYLFIKKPATTASA